MQTSINDTWLPNFAQNKSLMCRKTSNIGSNIKSTNRSLHTNGRIILPAIVKTPNLYMTIHKIKKYERSTKIGYIPRTHTRMNPVQTNPRFVDILDNAHPRRFVTENQARFGKPLLNRSKSMSDPPIQTNSGVDYISDNERPRCFVTENRARFGKPPLNRSKSMSDPPIQTNSGVDYIPDNERPRCFVTENHI
jgi:hypothetical protein